MTSKHVAMKKITFLIVVACLAGYSLSATPGSGSIWEAKTGDDSPVKGTISITASPDLNDLANRWIAGFSAGNPGTRINLSNESSTGADLHVISEAYKGAAPAGDGWRMVIGRDIIVPVISSSNPYLDEIRNNGISALELSAAIKNNAGSAWNLLLGEGHPGEVKFYAIEDESVRRSITRFIGLGSISFKPVAQPTGEELLQMVDSEPLSIGFCRLADLLDPDGQTLMKEVTLLPIDRNGNGKLDYMENIYESGASFLRGVWIGKYPSDLGRDILLSAAGKPSGKDEIAFIHYLLNDGQKTLSMAGFNGLVLSERQSKIDSFPLSEPAPVPGGINVLQLLLTLIAGALVVILATAMIIRYIRQNKPVRMEAVRAPGTALNENILTAPGGLYYDKSHTWAYMEKNGTVKVGIDDFLQHVTGPITRVLLKRPGDRVTKGQPVLTVMHKGKHLVVSAPVSGTIVAQNAGLFTDSTLLNDSPYTDGWVYAIEPTNWIHEVQLLLMSPNYKEWLRNELGRLRDFILSVVKPDTPEFACVTLQDGGELTDHVLSGLEPEVWEEFQNRFLDNANSSNTI